MKQKLLGLFVLFALLMNVFSASADTLSDYTKQYNHLTSKYNYIDASYATASSNYNAIKNSGDLYDIQKLINTLTGIQTNAQSGAEKSTQYASELIQLGGAQETQLANDFKWLAVVFQNFKDKATLDIAGLEQASEKQQTKVELQVQSSLLNKLLIKAQEEKASFSVLATIGHIKTLDKAITDMQKLQNLKFDLLDHIALAITNEDKAYVAGETELENSFMSVKYELYALQNEVKSDEAKIKEFIATKAPEEISTIKAEVVAAKKTISSLEIDLDKAQCAQDKQGIFNTMTSLNTLAQKDLQDKKSFLYTRANGLAEFSLPEAELYFEQIKQYEDLVDSVTTVLNKPFNSASCPNNGNPQPPQPPVNKAPIFTKVNNQDVKPNTPLAFGVKPTEKIEFTITATDEDKDVLTYSVENAPVGAVFDPAKQTFSWTPTNTQTGIYTIGFKVIDGKNGEAKIDILIGVSAAGQPPVITNKAPVFTKVGTQDVKVGVTNNFGVKPTEKIEFTITATDEDKDVLTYSVENAPVGAVFDPAKQTFSWTPTNTQSGTYTITFKVVDNKGGDAKTSISISVSATGQPVPPPAVLTPQEQTFKDLKNQFDIYEEDFNSYEKSYLNAVKKDDSSAINKYKKKLKNLDDDLKSLDDKLDNLLSEVEKLPNLSGLESDIEDKIDDLKSLRQDIKDVLDGKQKTSGTSNTLATKQVTGTTKIASQEKNVIVEKLPVLPGPAPIVAAEQTEESTTSFGMMAGLIGGVIVLIAVIIFLLALLLA